MHWFRNIYSFIHTAKKKKIITKIITSNVGKLRHLVRAESHKNSYTRLTISISSTNTRQIAIKNQDDI